MADRPPIPRPVKPRRPAKTELPLLVVTPQEVLIEASGEVFPREQLGQLLREHPPAMIACGNPEALLAELHRELKDDPLWQFRVSPLIRERWAPNGDTIETQEEIVVGFFGFKRPNGRSSSRYFYPIAPGQFCRQTARQLSPQAATYLEALRDWAISVRRFCAAYELRPTPTQGGIAAQLLRHPLFYPEPRRKIPKSTNEKARPRLPGNWYELRAETGRTYAAAWYLDQANAHHFAASSIELPQADRLRAHGHFREPDACRPWLRSGSAGFQSVVAQHGLLRVRLDVPSAAAHAPFPPPVLSRAGTVDAWIFTNELAGIIARGARVKWLSAAWVSPDPDEGIRRYASWATEEVKNRPADRWLKGTLLSSYGILAARPRHLRFAYWQAKSGERDRIRLAADMVEVWSRKTTREHQSPIANVIQRGMIEAETRRLSIDLAGQLTQLGHEVFSIYADAVLVRARDGARPAEALPLLPEPWRIKNDLSWIRFHNPQAFECRELRRLPGVRRGKIGDSP